jgi:SAM-dependent methyltransferase
MTAFDLLAPTYDKDFTGSPIARWLRDQTYRRLDSLLHGGDSVLELGCGTGEDALYLARRGVRVLATDASEEMLALAGAKAEGEPLMSVQTLDIGNLHESDELQFIDGAFANFGVLNCLSEWRTLAAWLAARIKPGGMVAFGVMAPFCLWEMGWHSLHADFRTAFRRVRGQTTFQPSGSGEQMTICYPTARRLERDFAPYFRRVMLRPLGLFLPPSDVYGMIEKRPRLLRSLVGLEQRFGNASAFALFADHYWIELKRSAEG